jgi:hypothetical protein
VFEETVAGLLAYLGADGVVGLLGFLEEFWDFYEAGVAHFLEVLGLFDVVEEDLVGLVVDLLRGALRFAAHVFLEGTDPIYLLFLHSNA